MSDSNRHHLNETQKMRATDMMSQVFLKAAPIIICTLQSADRRKQLSHHGLGKILDKLLQR